MTWSHDPATGYFTNSDATANWQEAFNSLNGKGDPTSNLGGWQVGTRNNETIFLFTFVDLGGVTRRSQCKIIYSNQQNYFVNREVNDDYDPTETDLSEYNAWPYKIGSSYGDRFYPYNSNSPIRLWQSSEDPAGFMFTQPASFSFAFAPATYRVAPYYTTTDDYLVDGSDKYDEYGKVYPGLLGFNIVGGYPCVRSDYTSTWGKQIEAIAGDWSRTDEAFTGLTFNNLGINFRGTSHGQIANDVLYSVPKNRAIGTNANFGTSPVVVTDAGKFYIYTKGVDYPGWIMDCGSSDPTAYLFGN